MLALGIVRLDEFQLTLRLQIGFLENIIDLARVKFLVLMVGNALNDVARSARAF